MYKHVGDIKRGQNSTKLLLLDEVEYTGERIESGNQYARRMIERINLLEVESLKVHNPTGNNALPQ